MKKEYRKICQFLLIFVVFCNIHISSIFPKLAISDFSEFLLESEIILIAKVKEIELEGKYGDGFAILAIEEILKGQYSEALIKIRWDSEVHDQRIGSLGWRLLFLKKLENGEYTGTHYGRSYWELKSTWVPLENPCKMFTLYLHPINTLNFDDFNIIKEIHFLDDHLSTKENPSIAPGICLEDLRDVINSQKSKETG